MRAAPNPNGPWHVGHARMPAVIGTYKERYDGKFICRFDDTDPETKRPDMDAYDAILEDIAYLGFEADRVLKASDRLETYYDHARDLIDAGGAYTCSCSGDDFSALKTTPRRAPTATKDTETVHEEFSAMVDGEYSAGEMVLRVRTDIEHKNPALPRLGCVPDDRHAAPARGSGRLPLLAHARLPVRRRRPPHRRHAHHPRDRPAGLREAPAVRLRLLRLGSTPRCSTGATCRSTSTT